MRPLPERQWQFPNGARFAFTIMDDTDVATVDNVQPIYRLFEELGMRTTKTVWMRAYRGGWSAFRMSETMEDPRYRDFVIDLHARGFEIAFHCASMESSERSTTSEALRQFTETFGAPPKVHANHSFNRENLYWGADRLDNSLLRALYRRTCGVPHGHYQGHMEGSPYYWGDLARSAITYVRNLTFDELNIARLNPSMPYRDPRRPLANWWFSAADAEGGKQFNALLHPDNQNRLEAEGGFCIVATHLGKGYCRGGRLDPTTQALLEQLASRQGWFPTVGELLDWLRSNSGEDQLPPDEWRHMQRRWMTDLAARNLKNKADRMGKRVNRMLTRSTRQVL